MASPADYGMVSINGGENWTNAPGTGLDASGNLLPGYKYGTYSNGIGQGTPQKIGDVGLLGNTVTGNNAPVVVGGTTPSNITVGPVATPGNTQPAATPGATSENLNAAASAPGGTTGNGTSSTSSYSTPAGIAGVTNWNVDPNQTVAGQFNGLIKSDNPLMQQARTSALQQANDRGLLNSSIATGASDLAAYNAALPIAQADAATYANAGKTNAGEANQTARTNASAYNTLQTANLSADTQKALAGMSQDTQLKVAELNKQYQQTIQGSTQAATMYSQAMDQLMKVYQNTDWDEASKQNVMANIIDGLAGGLQLIKSIDGIDLSGWLDFVNNP